MHRWAAGTTIVHHEVWAGRVWAARPLIVVADTDENLLAWIPRGTVRKVPAPPPAGADVAASGRRGTEASHHGIVENLASGLWEHIDHVWDVDSLWVLEPDAWSATWVSWTPEGHLGWYVNIQRPYRRTTVGIEAMDLMLDVVVEPDRSWRWKDAAELDELERRGLFDAATLAAVRAEGQRAVARIEAGAPPFCDPWPSWRPDPAWGRPVLPEGWDEVPATP